ncbi:hypothetical protein M8494_18045 [Serratia ureilytica]
MPMAGVLTVHVAPPPRPGGRRRFLLNADIGWLTIIGLAIYSGRRDLFRPPTTSTEKPIPLSIGCWNSCSWRRRNRVPEGQAPLGDRIQPPAPAWWRR